MNSSDELETNGSISLADRARQAWEAKQAADRAEEERAEKSRLDAERRDWSERLRKELMDFANALGDEHPIIDIYWDQVQFHYFKGARAGEVPVSIYEGLSLTFHSRLRLICLCGHCKAIWMSHTSPRDLTSLGECLSEKCPECLSGVSS